VYPYVTLFFSFIFWIAGDLGARIGEKRSTMESRLLKSNGIVLRSDEIIEERQTGMPYLDYEVFFPKPYEVRLYFKSSDGSRPKQDELETNNLKQAFDRKSVPKKPLSTIDPTEKKLEGWELHVLYIQGISVLEVYKKTNSITEQELNYLLTLQSGKSFWTESTSANLPEGKHSALGFDFARADHYLRAKKISSRSIMFFRTQTDEFFHKALMKEREEEAPESIKGF
jgi:hypothetical protein